jgi:hypothetical protein
MKYRLVLLLGVLVSLLACCTGGYDDRADRGGDAKAPYGVFVGADPEDADILLGYRLVVIDAAYFSEAEIETLHKRGTKVCSYLNIGSVETFRDDYAAYRHLVLGEYENWPDEYWVDVSRPEWQAHILSEAGSLADKGVDGFFLDNADVYDRYPKTEIFQGLVALVDGLAQYGKDILINGGDVFVTEAILDADAPRIRITGVNQECVFTDIDFENNTTTRQSPEVSEYYQSYLERCKELGLSVYLTEYGENPEDGMWETLDAYCAKHRFAYFISPSETLDKAGVQWSH